MARAYKSPRYHGRSIRKVGTVKLQLTNKSNILAICDRMYEELNKKRKTFSLFQKALDDILVNMSHRYYMDFAGVGAKKKINVVEAMRNSSKVCLTNNNVTISVADPEKMDRLTMLPPTKSEGKIYHLWSLLREGWGKAGGKRNDSYVLYVIINGAAKIPPYRSVLREVENGVEIKRNLFMVQGTIYGNKNYTTLYKLVKHPGFKGRDWITTLNNLPYSEDLYIFNKAIEDAVGILGNMFSKDKSELVLM